MLQFIVRQIKKNLLKPVQCLNSIGKNNPSFGLQEWFTSTLIIWK